MRVNANLRIAVVVSSILLSICVFITSCAHKTDLEVGVSALNKGDYIKAVESFRK
jgi:hypothetical protein